MDILPPSSSSRIPVEKGQIVGQKYAIGEVIGRGGMGVVVSARHQELGHEVAIKLVSRRIVDGEGGERAKARLVREARAAARIQSEHIARVFDVGTLETGEPFVVMERLIGESLSGVLRTRAAVPVAEAAEYALQACEGLAAAHAEGLIHRDLKPENLFVTRKSNGTPCVKLLDFGIAKSLRTDEAFDRTLTGPRVTLGSPLYMSPEQMRASPVLDARTDVWSLGVVLYELVTGEVPFDGDSVTEVCAKIVGEPLTFPDDFDIPDSLRAIIVRCLEKDPKDRFQTVATLADALEPLASSTLRSTPERGWRSLAETQEPLDRDPPALALGPARDEVSTGDMTTPEGGSPGAQPEPKTGLERTTGIAWRASNPAHPPRRRGFVRGMLLGAALMGTFAAGLVTAQRLRASDSPDSEPTLAKSLEVSHASNPAAPVRTPRARRPSESVEGRDHAAKAPSRSASPGAAIAARAAKARRAAASGHASPSDDAPTTREAARDGGAASSAAKTTANGAPILH